jgi:hypothetical protein
MLRDDDYPDDGATLTERIDLGKRFASLFCDHIDAKVREVRGKILAVRDNRTLKSRICVVSSNCRHDNDELVIDAGFEIIRHLANLFHVAPRDEHPVDPD